MAGAPDPLQPLPPDPVTVRAIRDCYRELGKIKGSVKLEPCDDDVVLDFDHTTMMFQKCTYQVGTLKFTRFIKRGLASSKDWAHNYHFVSALRHPAAMQVENFFHPECVVVSEVNGSFDKWLNTIETPELFTEEGDMCPILRKMVNQLAGLLESIIAEGKCPQELSMKDLYIKLLLPGSIPKLQVLILKVKESSFIAEEQAWASVRDIVTQCFKRHHVKPSQASEDFISCIGILTENTQALLEDHPDQWDNMKKGAFLMESYSYSQQVSHMVNASELKWPVEEDGVTTPVLLSDLIRYGEKHARYDKEFPSNYVRLLRNSYKHFKDLPEHIKQKLGGNTDGLIQQVEKWSPRIWHILYVALHMPRK
ncbi:uncharacterized protein [Aegilops tauschii subsp. strangulata]|nr:uncharacterized protein LOC109786169 isoform X1 [Aegilops tauschii subsp. strangulata]